MERSVYRFSLDIRDSIGACQPEMKQGDTHRRLCINLTDGGVPYPIGEGCRVVFTAKKPDGTVICNTCCVENNTVIYDITPQTTADAGILNCELQLYDGTAEPLELITSAAFRIRVHPRVYNENDIPASESESTGISAMLHRAEQAIEALSEAKESGEFDGMPATHQWNGTVLTVTSGSGTSSADLKGEKGDPGTLALDDTVVGQTGWSSKHILDRLCPPIEEAGSVVQCRPAEGYPLEVTTHIRPTAQTQSALTLTRCGKNLFDHTKTTFTNDYINVNNGAQGSSSGYSCTGFIPCAHLQGQTITLNHPPMETGGGNPGMGFYSRMPESPYYQDPGYLGHGGAANGYTAVVPKDAVYMRFSVPRKYADGTQIQLELGSTVTEYEPYTEKTYTVVPDTGCQGGSFDWNTGILTLTHKKVDMASLDWQYNEDNCCFYADLPGAAGGTALCSYLTQAPGRFDDIISGGYGMGEPDCVFDISDGTIAVIYNEADNVGDFMSDIEPMEVRLVYPLAEPATQKLVATPIPANAGINTLYSTTGDTRVVGRADPAATLEAITNAILSLGGNI